MLELTPEQEARLREILAVSEEEAAGMASRIVAEAMSDPNVERFGNKISERLLPEMEALFGMAMTHVQRLEARVDLLERLVMRALPVGPVVRS